MQIIMHECASHTCMLAQASLPYVRRKSSLVSPTSIYPAAAAAATPRKLSVQQELAVSASLASSDAPSSASAHHGAGRKLSQSTVTLPTAWVCLNIPEPGSALPWIPIRRNKLHYAECLATDGLSCIRAADESACKSLAAVSNMFASCSNCSSIKLLSCGIDMWNKKFVTGYESAASWCSIGRASLPDTPVTLPSAWECLNVGPINGSYQEWVNIRRTVSHGLDCISRDPWGCGWLGAFHPQSECIAQAIPPTSYNMAFACDPVTMGGIGGWCWKANVTLVDLPAALPSSPGTIALLSQVHRSD
jgi:hypothetical protein